LITMSQKLQENSLKTMRMDRENKDLRAQNDFFAEKVKTKDDTIAILEERVSKLEGEVHRIEETYREKTNEYQKRFLRIRFDQQEQQAKETKASLWKNKLVSGKRVDLLHEKISDAGSLTANDVRHLRDEELEKLSEKQQSNKFGSYEDNWTSHAMLEEKDRRIAEMVQKCADLKALLDQKSTEVDRLRRDDHQDLYLSNDDKYLKDAIEDQRIKIMATARREQSEVTQAAY